MSRSFRKTPIISICSNKKQQIFKQREHRAERTLVNKLLRLITLKDSDKIVLNFPHKKRFGNEWTSPRDGKAWHGTISASWTSEDIKKILRK